MSAVKWAVIGVTIITFVGVIGFMIVYLINNNPLSNYINTATEEQAGWSQDTREEMKDYNNIFQQFLGNGVNWWNKVWGGDENGGE
jgi:ABC-type dipeptide/oligopeptide/nickel transport system permease component